MIDDFAKEYLHSDLREIREAMLWKLDGLSEYDIRRPRQSRCRACRWAGRDPLLDPLRGHPQSCGEVGLRPSQRHARGLQHRGTRTGQIVIAAR
jgi:hypothetical protein